MGPRPLRHVAPLALALALAAPAVAAEQAGVSAAVRGTVELSRGGAVVGRQVASGEEIFLEDRIASGPRSGMQILLLDQTVFTIGPRSEIVVDEFVYDPADSTGKLTARVAKGVFRFVTGRIARQDAKDMRVELPAGTIGLRGTIACGEADPVTSESLAVLLGEGPDTDTPEGPSGIELCNVGRCTAITRPGFGARIPGPDDPPTKPFRVAQEDLDRLLDRLDEGTGDTDPGDPATAADREVDPTRAARSEDGLARRRARQALGELDDDDLLYQLTSFAEQDRRDESVEPAGMPLGFVPNHPTTFDELRSLAGGQFRYTDSNVPMTGGNVYTFSMDIDLGARTIAGGNSFVQVAGPESGTAGFVNPLSYQNASGIATFGFGFSGISGTNCGSGCTGTLTLGLQNTQGEIAGEAHHAVDVFDFGGSLLSSGSGTAPRTPGSTP